VGESVPGMGQPTADRLRHQARLQVEARADGRVRYELLEPQDGRGLLTLPEPSAGDLFFDLEGDPWAADGGLEYLFGVGDAVDRYRVGLQGGGVSQEGYGLKRLEPLYLPAREGELKDGASSIVWYEDWLESGDPALLDGIRAYNEIDCVSTLRLRDWLEVRRR